MRRTPRLAAAAAFLATLGTSGGSAADPAPASCERVGPSADQHTCFHGSHGPFANVGSTPYPGSEPVYSVDAPHTLFTVALSGEIANNQSAVLYRPVISDPHAFYSDRPYPLQLLRANGEAVPLRFEHEITSCSEYFSWLSVYDLDEEETYTLVLGPTNDDEFVQMVIERLPAFLDTLYPDGDGDGFGVPSQAVASWCGAAPGYSLVSGDCNDADPEIFPGASERCNGVDDNCNGLVDEGGDSLCSDDPDGPTCLSLGMRTGCGWCATREHCGGDECIDGVCERSETNTGGMGASSDGGSLPEEVGGSTAASGGLSAGDAPKGGCSCLLASSSPSNQHVPWLALGAGLAALRWRRARVSGPAVSERRRIMGAWVRSH